jgi:hypothetical protein
MSDGVLASYLFGSKDYKQTKSVVEGWFSKQWRQQVLLLVLLRGAAALATPTFSNNRQHVCAL